MFVYFDASALSKRYASEVGTEVVNAVFDLVPREKMTCSNVGLLEVVSVLVRKRNRNELPTATLNEVLLKLYEEIVLDNDFQLIAVADSLVYRAIDLILRHNINATDAIILRSCLDLRATEIPQLVLWSCDKRLVRAANHEGLAVFDPEFQTVDALRSWLAG